MCELCSVYRCRKKIGGGWYKSRFFVLQCSCKIVAKFQKSIRSHLNWFIIECPLSRKKDEGFRKRRLPIIHLNFQEGLVQVITPISDVFFFGYCTPWTYKLPRLCRRLFFLGGGGGGGWYLLVSDLVTFCVRNKYKKTTVLCAFWHG